MSNLTPIFNVEEISSLAASGMSEVNIELINSISEEILHEIDQSIFTSINAATDFGMINRKANKFSLTNIMIIKL